MQISVFLQKTFVVGLNAVFAVLRTFDRRYVVLAYDPRNDLFILLIELCMEFFTSKFPTFIFSLALDLTTKTKSPQMCTLVRNA